MNNHTDKTQENKTHSVANRVTQKLNGSESTFQFIDNRPEVVLQKKVQEMANNSHQASQQNTIQRLIDTTIQRMGWTWNGSNWTPDDHETTLAQPARDGKGKYEYYDDGLGDGKAKVVDPPAGYELAKTQMGTQSAYVLNTNNHQISNVAKDHLVEVANGDKAREHRSSKMKGHSSPTYVHPNDDELYTYQINGRHKDGIPKISVLEQGKVRDGFHKFK